MSLPDNLLEPDNLIETGCNHNKDFYATVYNNLLYCENCFWNLRALDCESDYASADDLQKEE